MTLPFFYLDVEFVVVTDLFPWREKPVPLSLYQQNTSTGGLAAHLDRDILDELRARMDTHRNLIIPITVLNCAQYPGEDITVVSYYVVQHLGITCMEIGKTELDRPKVPVYVHVRSRMRVSQLAIDRLFKLHALLTTF